VAEMVWRRVQVWRPRESMSGGQSGVGVVVVETVEAFWEEVEREVRIMAAQSAEEVQVRQL